LTYAPPLISTLGSARPELRSPGSSLCFARSPLCAGRSDWLFSSWTEGDERFPKPLGIVSKPFAVISKGFEMVQKLCRSRLNDRQKGVKKVLTPAWATLPLSREKPDRHQRERREKDWQRELPNIFDEAWRGHARMFGDWSDQRAVGQPNSAPQQTSALIGTSESRKSLPASAMAIESYAS